MSRSVPKTFLVGIAGGSGSGKTTIARKIASALPAQSVVLLEHDSYYKDHSDIPFEERKLINYDHPDSLDNALLVQHLDLLRQGVSIQVPRYSYVDHTRQHETHTVEPCAIILLEGILIFADQELRDRLDVKLFVDTDADLRAFRRIHRDMKSRGRSFDDIREQYFNSVRPMHLQFVEPSKRWADLIIPEGGNNRVALDLVVARLRQEILSP